MDKKNIVVEMYRNRSEMEVSIIDKDSGEVLFDRLPVSWRSLENKLDYLSVSKISMYEQCPASFYRQYMSDDGVQEDNSNFFTKFGSILHEVVEYASKYYNENGIIIDAVTIYDKVWKEHDLVDFEAYIEGKGLIMDYFARNPVDKRTDDMLFAEKEWRGELGGCTFGLILDYAGVMKDDPNTGILKDYKSNRMPFTPNELDTSLQLKIYEIVLRRHLAPDIKDWVTGYEMFRFGWQQCPPRTQNDLDEAENYVSNVWHQICNDNVWEEKLNNYCGYRKCRFTCKTYQDYVNNPQRYVDSINTDDMDYSALEKQRTQLATYEKVAKTRKDECATTLRVAIENAMKRGEKFVVDGEQLELYSNATQSYDYYNTRNVLLLNNELNILDDCLSIGKTKLDKILKTKPELKLQLTSCMNTNYASPYIIKKKSK